MLRGHGIGWLRGRLPIALLIGFLLICALFGGASRIDALSQPVVRIAAVAYMLYCICCLRIDFRPLRIPLALLGLLAAWMCLQLIPLPPALWTALPGRAPYVPVAEIADIPQPWRPISLTPDLTLNSLLALLPPLAVLLGMSSVSSDDRKALLFPLLGVIFVSGLLGIAQIGQRGPGALYLYEITNIGSAVGLFANRNHQAVMLALGLPLLAIWARPSPRDTLTPVLRYWLALAAGAMLLPLILVTGSRAGLLAAVLGFLLAYGLWFFSTTSARPKTVAGRRLLFAAVPLLVAVALVGMTMMRSRAIAILRLTGGDSADEARFLVFKPLIELARTFMPVGSGFGSFVSVFRQYEPFDVLAFTYLNHAHNDLLELIIEGGLPALLLLIAFCTWWARRTLILWKRTARTTRGTDFGRAGAGIVLMLLLASLPDYPLRTPLMSAIFAIALGWMAFASVPEAAGRGSSH